ncbi:MAG: hypothetical protein U5J63_08735 [Fodinibius sp.]|nr:hypothetical protein [Fodinibius sp.]
MRNFGGHSYKGAYPHPEKSTGTAHKNGNRHAADIAHAHSSGQGARQGFEVRNITGIVGIVVLSPQDVEGVFKVFKRGKAGIDQEEKSAANQQDDERHAPHEA